MAVIRIKIKNLNALTRSLANYPQISGRHIANAINKSLADIAQRTLPITPKKSGDLRSTMQLSDIKRATPRELVGTYGPDTQRIPYAVAVHDFGGRTRYKNPTTAGTLPQFLARGAKRAQQKVDQNFDKALDNITDELAV